MRDGDHSIAAHLLRIKDPETGTGLSDDLLAGEIGMFFTAGTPSPSLVYLQPRLHLDQVLWPGARSFIPAHGSCAVRETGDRNLKQDYQWRMENSLSQQDLALLPAQRGQCKLKLLLVLAGLETSGNQITWIL